MRRITLYLSRCQKVSLFLGNLIVVTFYQYLLFIADKGTVIAEDDLAPSGSDDLLCSSRQSEKLDRLHSCLPQVSRAMCAFFLVLYVSQILRFIRPVATESLHFVLTKR